MQIEKPKPVLPPWAVFAAVIGGLLILSLPFLAGSSSSKKPAEVKPAAAAEPDTSDLKEETPAAESGNAVQAEVLPAALAEAPPMEVPAELTPEQSQVPVQAEPADIKTVNPEPAAAAVKTPQAVSLFKDQSPALLTSFYGNVKILGPNGEVKAEKNKQLLEGQTIEVGASGEAVLEIEKLYVLRIKPNSKLTHLEPQKDEAFSGKERVTYRFKLDRGALLGTTKYRGDKTSLLSLVVQDKVFNIQDSTFRAQLDDSSPWIGVLRGSVKSMEDTPNQKPVVIHSLEKVPLTAEPVSEPIKVTEQEWGLLRETYEMGLKTAAEEAMQLDLSKRAGDFFGYVFDHGTFFTENVGYTVRDFYEDKASGNVYLEAEYDVFPSNSFVGLYVLTRELDAKDYAGLRFDVRRKPDEGYPDRFFIEIKSKGQIIHRFEITDVKPQWEPRQIDFFNSVSTPITEVTLVFLNENVGANKKGYIQMRNLQLVPLTAEQAAQRDETAKKEDLRAKAGPKMLPQAPRSLKQAVVTPSPVKKARRIVENEGKAVPYKADASQKIADEIPKVVSFDDLN